MKLKSDADLEQERALLIVRLTEAYCNALYADDNVRFSEAHIKLVEEQLQQANGRFDRGFGTITEINEAKAAHEMAVADRIESLHSRDASYRELEELIGVNPDKLCRLQPARLVLQSPQPVSVDSWLQLALSDNHGVFAARQEMHAARREIMKQRAVRYPTLDLVGSRTYSESDNNYSIGSIYDTYSISLQANLPIYTGGYASAGVRQAKAKSLKAEEQLAWQEREVESDVRKFYNGILSSMAQVNAYEQAVMANETALIGTKKGFAAGLRSNIDVLDAQQKLFDSKRMLAKSRYQYILNKLMLKHIAGILKAADVVEVSGWMQ